MRMCTDRWFKMEVALILTWLVHVGLSVRPPHSSPLNLHHSSTSPHIYSSPHHLSSTHQRHSSTSPQVSSDSSSPENRVVAPNYSAFDIIEKRVLDGRSDGNLDERNEIERTYNHPNDEHNNNSDGRTFEHSNNKGIHERTFIHSSDKTTDDRIERFLEHSNMERSEPRNTEERKQNNNNDGIIDAINEGKKTSNESVPINVRNEGEESINDRNKNEIKGKQESNEGSSSRPNRRKNRKRYLGKVREGVRKMRRWNKKLMRTRNRLRGNGTSKRTSKHILRNGSGGRRFRPGTPRHGKPRPGTLRHRPPHPRGGWSFRHQLSSLDPRRAKVRRHLVRQHNLLRSQVHPTPANMLAVTWYDAAAEQAQSWAEQCHGEPRPDHPSARWTSRYGACGQNILASPTKKRWGHVLGQWYGARRHFQYGASTISNTTLVAPYIQMVWYNSHQVGCGFAQCSTTGGDTFYRYVCNYCPAGNDPVRLSRPYTAGATCGHCPNSCRSPCHQSRPCRLCTNTCQYSDLWLNCGALDVYWHEWLCNTKTKQGVNRFRNCRATCQCANEIT